MDNCNVEFKGCYTITLLYKQYLQPGGLKGAEQSHYFLLNEQCARNNPLNAKHADSR